ncbi:MAG: HEAT repeat domain-containing protein [Myxococcales bacterium]|nr:HEAT repeat domain-containing protein [Myxococcales bacterium]
MGLLDIFKSKDERAEKSREKAIARSLNKYAQSPDRLRALEALAQDGSEEALFGMLRRFGFQYDKSIDDEQEKEWVFETLAGKGDKALAPVRRYLKSADSVSWPLRLLSQIAASRQQEVEVLGEVLERHEPGYERDPTKKIQILTHLGQIKEAGISKLVAPYLEDMDEGVRYAAAEALLRHKEEATSRTALLTVFVSEGEDSVRLRRRIAEGFADLGWSTGELRAAVEAKLPDGFQLDKAGHVQKK